MASGRAAATSWALAKFISATTTLQPSLAKRSAIAAPKPWAAPVTIAVCPSSFSFSCLSGKVHTSYHSTSLGLTGKQGAHPQPLLSNNHLEKAWQQHWADVFPAQAGELEAVRETAAKPQSCLGNFRPVLHRDLL